MVCLLVTVGILCICVPIKAQASERHLTGDTEVSTVINPAGTATTHEEVGSLNTANTVSITYNNGNGQINGALRILITLTLIALAPTIIIMMTSFTRIIIVLHFTRSALNTQTAPPNQILIGLALILTFFIMEPTITRINEEAIQPFEAGTIDQSEALEKGMAPLREFMYPQTQVKDVELFMDIAGLEWDGTLEDIPNSVLVPSFMISELRTAFWIGFMIYIPFIVIDMGTATTASVVNSKKQYVGGMILPGVGVSLDALTARASQLSGISIDAPRHVIGKNTIECMKSGVLYSNAAALDGIIDRIEEELGEKATVVATGGLAKKIVPHCKREIILDEELLLRGLLIIYEKNK